MNGVCNNVDEPYLVTFSFCLLRYTTRIHEVELFASHIPKKLMLLLQ